MEKLKQRGKIRENSYEVGIMEERMGDLVLGYTQSCSTLDLTFNELFSYGNHTAIVEHCIELKYGRLIFIVRMLSLRTRAKSVSSPVKFWDLRKPNLHKAAQTLFPFVRSKGYE